MALSLMAMLMSVHSLSWRRHRGLRPLPLALCENTLFDLLDRAVLAFLQRPSQRVIVVRSLDGGGGILAVCQIRVGFANPLKKSEQSLIKASSFDQVRTVSGV